MLYVESLKSFQTTRSSVETDQFNPYGKKVGQVQIGLREWENVG